MNTAIDILSKAIVAQFYKQYAIFFFVGLYVAFGILKISDHTYLNQSILSSSSLIIVYFILWTAYHILVLHFFAQSLKQNQLKFLYQLELYDVVPKVLSLLAMQVQLLLPTLAYAVFVLFIAIGVKAWLFVWVMPIYFAGMMGMGIGYALRLLKKPNISPSTYSWQVGWLGSFRKPGFSFYFFELFFNQSVVVFFSKTIACLILAACLYMFKTDDILDLRPLLLGLFLAMTANLPLVKIYHQYENQTLRYFKNLPVGKYQSLLHAGLTMVVLSLPELILAFNLLPKESWSVQLVMSVFYLPGLLTLYYSLLFHPQQTNPTFDNWLFAGGFIWFLGIMFSVPPLVFIIISLGMAWWMVGRYFYQYEFLVKEEE